jgi:hypothetical protein
MRRAETEITSPQSSILRRWGRVDLDYFHMHMMLRPLPIPLGWPRGQLLYRATLFLDSDPVDQALLGVLSSPMEVTNAVNLSLFMVNAAYQLRTNVRQRAPDDSLLDLKADCPGSKKYVEKTIKLLLENPEPVLLAMMLNRSPTLKSGTSRAS